jgi:hypothetical protein
MVMPVDMAVVHQNEVFYLAMIAVDCNNYCYYYFVDTDVYCYHWQNLDFLQNKNRMTLIALVENKNYVDEMTLVNENYSVAGID